jgi:fatty acid desaturase
MQVMVGAHAPAALSAASAVDKAPGAVPLAEYALSLASLFLGWMVALFGLAGDVRPAGLQAFAVTAASGVGFLAVSWLIYGGNLQTLHWVADLMEERVVGTRRNWENHKLRSLIEVGAWLHLTFRFYEALGSAPLSAVAGALSGALCVVLGEYFSDYVRCLERRLVERAESGLVSGYRQYLRSVSSDGPEVGAAGGEPAADVSAEPAPTPASSSAPLLPPPPPSLEHARFVKRLELELVSVFVTPQFVSLSCAFLFSLALYHFKDSQDLGLALILTALTNVSFITCEQVLMLWRPARWAAVIFHDRVLNVVYNWQHETLRSGFETCFYLSAIFTSYALTENAPLAVLAGTLTGMVVVLASHRVGVGARPPVGLASRDTECGVFMLAVLGWAVVTLTYTIWVFSRSSMLALSVAAPTCVATICVAGEASRSGRAAASALLPEPPGTRPVAEAPRSMWTVLASTLHSLRLLVADEPRQGRLAAVRLDDVLRQEEARQLLAEAAEAAGPEQGAEGAGAGGLDAFLAGARRRFAEQGSRVLSSDECKHKSLVVLHGFLFDVRALAPAHPGGEDLLLDYASRQADVSDLFAAFHHPALYTRLVPLLVGKLQEQSPCEPAAGRRVAPPAGGDWAQATKELGMLREFLRRNGYFKGAENDLDVVASLAHQLLVVFSLGVLVVCQVLLLRHNLGAVGLGTEATGTTVTGATAPALLRAMLYAQCVLAAVTLGIFWQQTAFVAHDALHNSVVNRTVQQRRKAKWLPNNVLGWVHGAVFFGISSAMWLDEHSTHHAMTMRPAADAQFGFLPLWCASLTETSRVLWRQMRTQTPILRTVAPLLERVQHHTFLPLAVLVGRLDFYACNVAYALRERVYFDLYGMAIFWALYAALLCQFEDSGLALCFLVVSHLTAGVLHVQLLSNHLATGADAPAGEEDGDLGDLGFFAFQIKTTRNIDSTPTWDWFHGGLQFQLEHHLFPMLPRHNLPSVQPAVRDICRRNGLHYNSVPFFLALRLCLDNIDSTADQVWEGNLLLA